METTHPEEIDQCVDIRYNDDDDEEEEVIGKVLQDLPHLDNDEVRGAGARERKLSLTTTMNFVPERKKFS